MRDVVAGILVGGASRRMGRPKALLPLGGETMLERVFRTARATCHDVVLLGTPRFDLPVTLRDRQIVPDIHPDIGPIGGLHAALASRPGSAVLLLACDLPELTSDLLGRLLVEGAEDATVFATSPPPAGWHPCCALYGPAARDMVTRQIQHGHYSLMSLLGSLRVRTIPLDAHEHMYLRNINSPEDVTRDAPCG